MVQTPGTPSEGIQPILRKMLLNQKEIIDSILAGGGTPANPSEVNLTQVGGTPVGSPLPVSLPTDPLPVSVASPLESNGAIPVNIQDQTSRALQLKFIMPTVAPTTLTAPTVEDSRVISVASVGGVTAGTTIGLVNPNGQFFFAEAVSVSVLDITLDTPCDEVFPIADTTVLVATSHMNVDGSVTPAHFRIAGVGAGTGIDIDITRIMGVISNSASMDDGTFGGIPILTNGCVLRKTNGTITSIWNVKSNGDIALICFDATYSTRAPGGENGFRFRNTYGGQSKHGVTIRLLPGEFLELIVQDDLTDLSDFQMMAQGHLVTD